MNYTFLSLFCGLGAGALGFCRARARLFGQEARFINLGGIDIEPAAVEDFKYLTKGPGLVANIAELQPAELRAFAGDVPPDVVFSSAPCKSFSGLTDPELAATPEYVQMAELYVTGLELVLSTWDIGPRLWIAENVPRILSAGAHLVDRVTRTLESHDYAVDVSSHDCGELGGLAQHRRRALLLGRQKRRVSALLYQPAKRKVRACGEVLGELPLPEDPSAGPMHRLPRVAWTTLVRLALVPAGGDHRDIPGALEALQKRREAWGRHRVECWASPSVTVACGGSNGAFGIADPRLVLKRGEDARAFTNICAVTDWNGPAPCVSTGTRPASGGPSVADPRLSSLHVATDFANNHRCYAWNAATGTITATGSRPIAGGPSVADPRLYAGPLGVAAWDAPAATVTQGGPTGTRASVADPRIVPQADNPNAHRNKYKVAGWNDAAGTVGGATRPGSGAPAVADPRASEWRGRLGVTDWSEPTGVITGNARPVTGPFTVADPRVGDGRHDVGVLGVVRWDEPTGTVKAQARVSTGPFAVADVRVGRTEGRNPDHCYRLLRWSEPSFTIHGKPNAGTGAYSVSDPRVLDGVDATLGCTPRAGAYGVISWLEAAKTITAAGSVDNGPFAVADVRVPDQMHPLCFIDSPRRSPFVLVEEPGKTPRSKAKVRRVDVPVVIIAEDGTWHRPMTPLELARLQDLPATVDGAPLKLHGDAVGAWVERIGNAVPVGAAQAIAEQMLLTLLSSDVGAGLAPSGGVVWVEPGHAEAC